MDEATTSAAFKAVEALSDHAIRVVGSAIEIFGVLIIVIGIAWSTYVHLLRPMHAEDTEIYKIRIGRSLLLGLEVLVAADIVKTIAHELSFVSLLPGAKLGAGNGSPESAVGRKTARSNRIEVDAGGRR